jgi:hypothetical protein
MRKSSQASGKGIGNGQQIRRGRNKNKSSQRKEHPYNCMQVHLKHKSSPDGRIKLSIHRTEHQTTLA